MLLFSVEAWMPLEDQYQCTQRYCEDYADDSELGKVGNCNRSHTTVPNEQPGSLWNGEIVPLANLTIGGALWCESGRSMAADQIFPPFHTSDQHSMCLFDF